MPDASLFRGLQPAGEAVEDLAKRLEAYETPPEALADLLAARPDLVPPGARVWEPCAGTLILAEALRRYEREVVTGDVHPWSDGLDEIADVLSIDRPRAPLVVTNPPFRQAHRIVEHLLRIGVETVVCFQAWNWYLSSPHSRTAQTAEAGRFFEDRPPAEILPLLRRVSLWRFDIPLHARGSSSPIRYCWYVWRAGHQGPTRPMRLPPAAKGGAG